MQSEKLREDDIVLCTVIKIVGTTVFVKIEEYEGIEGSIITSEISSGRIRNLRDYVVPNKKIVCKVLRVDRPNHVQFSLRRVSEKEKKQVLEKHRKEKTALNILKSVVKDSSIVKKIKQENKSINEFLEKAKENPRLPTKFLLKKDADALIKILKERKEKQKIVKKQFFLKSNKPDGIKIIKKILIKVIDDKNIRYIAAGHYMISIKTLNPKQTSAEINKILENIEKKAKEQGCEFIIKEK